ncbi:hypothetical protein ACFYV7_15115 [Nocardia suismassiliense]|uniref:Threonine dehydrogenase or related Zn-dependent dehydrogenase n=1 Tax=Nocardia suismassiliense TaxID=2077092 RepID=A0ABW6QSC3_9NOCA
MDAVIKSLDNCALVRDGGDMRLRRMVDLVHRDTDAVYRVLRVGICGTDLQIQRGARTDQAEVLGHEGIGLRINNSDSNTVAECEIFNPVDPNDQDSILGHSYDGLLRNYLVDDNPSRRTTAAHAALPVDLGPLVEPLGAVIYAWELMRPRLGPGAPVAIFGAGTAAILLAILGEDFGYRPRLIHPRQERLDFVSELDVLRNVGFSDSAAPDSAAGVFLCLPREATSDVVALAADCVTEDGIIDLFGGVPAGLRHPCLPHIDLGAIRRHNVCGQTPRHPHTPALTDTGKAVWATGHRGTSPQHLDQAQVRLIDEADRYATLITDIISMDAAAQRIPLMARRHRPHREHVKVVVDPTMKAASRPIDPHATVSDLLRRTR